MAPFGRPTPPPVGDRRPLYRDVPVEELKNRDANPYVADHREFSTNLVPGDEAWRWKGHWSGLFGREAPLHLELGSGNGFFLSGMAKRNPDWNWIGLEIRYKRVVLCAKKVDAVGVTNARVVRYDAFFLKDLFDDASLDGLYVNHPDPWPRDKDEKHRLISRWFLEEVGRLLKPGAWLRIKSDYLDNVDRVARLLAADGEGNPLPALPLEITGRGEDVTKEPPPWGPDVETNYQRKFREKGLPVYALEVRRTDAPLPAPTYDRPLRWVPGLDKAEGST
jgi:tRNA (guanine-N7-)-methyltransferase